MINKKHKKFSQYLDHGSEPREFEKFVDEIAPLIGYIVQTFNSLEQSLNSMICEILNDRTEELGFLVIHSLSFSNKVDLLDRLLNSYHIATRTNSKKLPKLISNLKESARLRNAVVHADWDSTDFEGYTFVKISPNAGGLQQEYLQFTEESLEKIDEFIDQTEQQLWEYEDYRYEIMRDQDKNGS